jgi:FimV-like protein
MSFYSRIFQRNRAVFCFVLATSLLLRAGLVYAVALDKVEAKIEVFENAESPSAVPNLATIVSDLHSTSLSKQYTVGKEDTLWSISRQITPNNATIKQTMIAIQRNNPTAFKNENIHQLRYGAVLDLPTAEVVIALDDKSASKIVKQQNNSASASGQIPITVSLEASKTTQYNASNYVTLASGNSSSTSVDNRKTSKGSVDNVKRFLIMDEYSKVRVPVKVSKIYTQKQEDIQESRMDLTQQTTVNVENSKSNDQDIVVVSLSDVSELKVVETVSVSFPTVENLSEPEIPVSNTVLLVRSTEPPLLTLTKNNLTYMLIIISVIVLVGVYYLKKRISQNNAYRLIKHTREENITAANKLSYSTSLDRARSAETRGSKNTVAEQFLGNEYEKKNNAEEEISSDSKSHLSIINTVNLDIACTSLDLAELDGDLSLENCDVDSDSNFNDLLAVDEDLVDDFLADLFTIKEGIEVLKEPADVDDLLDTNAPAKVGPDSAMTSDEV